MKDHTYSGNDTIYVFNFSAEAKWSCVWSRTQEGSTVCLFREFVNDSALAAIKEPLTLTLNDANMHVGTSTAYEGVRNHLFELLHHWALTENAIVTNPIWK